MMKAKDPNDVRGVKIHCPAYEKCPLCFGCRAFNSAYLECVECELDGRKKNICNTEKHRPDLLSKMITREIITLTSGEVREQ